LHRGCGLSTNPDLLAEAAADAMPATPDAPFATSAATGVETVGDDGQQILYTMLRGTVLYLHTTSLPLEAPLGEAKRPPPHFSKLVSIVMMNKKFEYVFTDESPRTISFDYDEKSEEKMSVVVENGTCVIYANQFALLTLAKVLVKMGLCGYQKGFHIHIGEDFDVDNPECLRVILSD
jgi:hypothetical protein